MHGTSFYFSVFLILCNYHFVIPQLDIRDLRKSCMSSYLMKISIYPLKFLSNFILLFFSVIYMFFDYENDLRSEFSAWNIQKEQFNDHPGPSRDAQSLNESYNNVMKFFLDWFISTLIHFIWFKGSNIPMWFIHQNHLSH